MSIQMDASSRAGEAVDSISPSVDAPTQTPVFQRIVRSVLGAVVLIAIFAAIGAHIRVSSAADEYSGALATLDRLFDLLLAGGVVAAAFSVGSTIAL